MIKLIYMKFLFYFKKKQYKKKWRIKNSHNETIPRAIYPLNMVDIGKYTYGCIDIAYFGRKEEYLSIGSFCSIANNVLFITGGGHYLNRFTTFPLERKLNGLKEETTKGKIIVKDDVWIGYGATILSGITIGQGAVIGANTTVSKDVPPYAVVVGNPGVIVKYRFSDEIINQLLKVNYKDISEMSKSDLINAYRRVISDTSQISRLFKKVV